MEYHSYFIVFPEGDQQEIDHPLSVGDCVDINGNIYDKTHPLHSKKIAYKVTGMSQKVHFKEVGWYYRLSMLNSDEVTEEMIYRDIAEKRRKEKLDKVYQNLEKKLRKKRGF